MRDYCSPPEVLTKGKIVWYGCIGTIGWFFISYIFYHSIWPAIVLEIVFLYFYFKQVRSCLRERQSRQLRREFQDTIQMLAMHLGAGHSIENAVTETSQQLCTVNGKQSFFARLLMVISKKIEIGIPVEAAWKEAAQHCGVEEVMIFARALELSKRSGASMTMILQKISQQMIMKIETRNQIDTMLAGKRMEQNVMNCMPAAILLYVSLTSPDLLQVMYDSISGRMVMTVSLAVYIAAYYLSIRITRFSQ